MKVFEYLDRIGRMNLMLQHRHTGTPVEFARRLGVSRTCLYEMIDELRSRGAPILYSKSGKTFYYEHPYDITITCSLHPLNYIEEIENSGGTKLFPTILFFRTLQSEISTVTLPC